jgi:hypothetical protein
VVESGLDIGPLWDPRAGISGLHRHKETGQGSLDTRACDRAGGAYTTTTSGSRPSASCVRAAWSEQGTICTGQVLHTPACAEEALPPVCIGTSVPRYVPLTGG